MGHIWMDSQFNGNVSCSRFGPQLDGLIVSLIQVQNSFIFTIRVSCLNSCYT